MAFVPMKMDETQIAFLANEITRTYMNGKNMGSQDQFAREYFNMYQKTMRIIHEEQSKDNSTKQSLQSLLDETPLEEESNSISLFR